MHLGLCTLLMSSFYNSTLLMKCAIVPKLSPHVSFVSVEPYTFITSPRASLTHSLASFTLVNDMTGCITPTAIRTFIIPCLPKSLKICSKTTLLSQDLQYMIFHPSKFPILPPSYIGIRLFVQTPTFTGPHRILYHLVSSKI